MKGSSMGPHAAYDQLLYLVSARATAWLRDQIQALPSPLPLCHPHTALLGRTGIVAAACSRLRGTPSPLEQVMTARLKSSPRLSRGSLGTVSIGLAGVPARNDLALRLARPRISGDLLRQAETVITTRMPSETLNDARVDAFAGVLMQLYDHGMQRPCLASRRSYGTAFQTCLSIAEWARKKGRLMPLAQMIFCLRLIDADHDVTDMLSDLISHQRPDGSFPLKSGYSMQDQVFGDACLPTLMAIMALHLTLHRRHNDPPIMGLAA